MKENTCMNITGKRPMPMLRNIDVINGIAERCREISLISTEIDTLCEMKQQNILDLPDSDERGLIEDVIAELAKTVFLLNKLSDYYIDRFEDTDFCFDEFLNYTDRSNYDTDILLSEFDSVMEEIWSLEAFCITELKLYKSMVQPCGANDFTQIVFKEDLECHTDF